MLRFTFIIPIAALVLLGQGCLDDPPQPNRPIIFDWKKDKQEEPVGSSTSTEVEIPTLQGGEIASASGAVVVGSIIPDQALPNPFVLLGRAVALEQKVYWRVRDGLGNDIASGAVVTDAAAERQFGSFRVRAFYDRVPQTVDGRVEVFTKSPGGLEQDLLTIPVMLQQKRTPVKVFFLNEKQDPGLTHCDQPDPVTRHIPKTDEPMEAAIIELLKGPTAAEQLTGSQTALLPGISLKRMTVEDDTATVDFSRQFALGIAGSCNVQALRAQVEYTLKQFSEIKNVHILVEGADAESVLQP